MNAKLAKKGAHRSGKIPVKLAQAIKLHEEGMLARAAIIYASILKEDPLHFDALHCMGILLFQKNETKTSIEFINKALVINPSYAPAHFNLGIALQKLNQQDQAVVSFDQALVLNPSYAEAHFKRGVALLELKRLDEAITSFNQAIISKPNYQQAYFGLGNALKALKKPIEAIDCFNHAVALKPNDPENYFGLGNVYYGMLTNAKIHSDPSLMAKIKSLAILNYELALKYNTQKKQIAEFDLSVLNGAQSLVTAPAEYVEALFDEYAAKFESHLVQDLQYTAPETLYQEIQNFISSDLDILDLGCGTGLMGKLLRPHAKKLIGLDLSTEMLKHAKSKNMYDDLIHSELNIFLKSNHAYFDLIVATDVLIYVGELEETFLNIKKALKLGAHFCFTVEEGEGDNFHLGSTARFSHSMNYCLDQAKKYGFTVAHIKKDILRFQDGTPVNGLFFCMKNNWTR